MAKRSRNQYIKKTGIQAMIPTNGIRAFVLFLPNGTE